MLTPFFTPTAGPTPELANGKDARVNDLAIACMRTALRGHWGGQASMSSPRPWLDKNQNSELARMSDGVWRGMDQALEELSHLPLDERPIQGEWASWFSCIARTTATSQGLDRALTDMDEDRGFARSGPAEAMSRDLERVHPHWIDSIGMIVEMPEEAKSGMLRSLGAKNDLASDSAQSSRPPLFSQRNAPNRPQSVADQVEHALAEFAKAALSPLAAAKSFLERFKPMPGDTDVEMKRLGMAQRFGLDGVTVACAHWFTPRQQLRWLDSTERALKDACFRLGIRENEFGGGGRTGLQVDPPEFSAARGYVGSITGVRPNNFVISVNPADANPSRVLVHEFTHQLDQLLAAKARSQSPDVFDRHRPQNSTDGCGKWYVFYSELMPEQMSLLPQAKQALVDVSSAFGQSSVIDKVRMFTGIGTNPLTGWRNPGQALAIAQGADLVRQMSRKFAIEHLGPDAYLKMSMADHKSYEASMGNAGQEFLLNVGLHLGAQPMDALIQNASAAVGTFENPTSFVALARGIHGDDEPQRRRDALWAVLPDLVELNARLHPMFQMAQSEGLPRPSKMLLDSVDRDARLLERGGRKYFSRPCELLARIVDRPQSVRELTSSKSTGDVWRDDYLSQEQLQRLNVGMAGMLDAAGIARIGPPRLGSVNEPAMHGMARWNVASNLTMRRLTQGMDALLKPGKRPTSSSAGAMH